MDEISNGYPVLNRLVTQSVNPDDLDYLAKRLDCFSKDEGVKFDYAWQHSWTFTALANTKLLRKAATSESRTTLRTKALNRKSKKSWRGTSRPPKSKAHDIVCGTFFLCGAPRTVTTLTR